MNATVSHNQIPVVHSIRKDVNREFLTIDVPEGWDDVKRISKTVLIYDGREFTFSGWNSDTNKAYFFRTYPFCGIQGVATFKD